MIKVAKSSVCSKGTMKNNKPSGKTSGSIIVSKNRPLGISSTASRNKAAPDSLSSVTSSTKKESVGKSQTNIYSSSQESLTGGITSVRRKTTAPGKVPATAGNKSEHPPIRMLNNLQSSPRVLSKKSTFKRSNHSNMRRAVSKDSVDLAAKEREKENVKILGRNKNSSNCITILQLEKEKAQMEQQISELVKNAESKKAEIATLKIELNKLKVFLNSYYFQSSFFIYILKFILLILYLMFAAIYKNGFY